MSYNTAIHVLYWSVCMCHVCVGCLGVSVCFVLFMCYCLNYYLYIIRLEARLQPNIAFTLRHVLAVFTRSAITPPKGN